MERIAKTQAKDHAYDFAEQSLPMSNNITAPRLPAYILAGGKSSRFGSDKAMAEIDGRPLISRVAEVLRDVCEPVTVVADEPGKYDALDLVTTTDLLPERGPLGGLHAALQDASTRNASDWFVVVSCDMVGLKREWVETIIGRIDGAPQTSAVVFHDDRWQPFPAVFHHRAFDIVGELLQSGTASFQRLLSDSRLNTLALPLPSNWPDVVQVNTREDLERLRGDCP